VTERKSVLLRLDPAVHDALAAADRHDHAGAFFDPGPV